MSRQKHPSPSHRAETCCSRDYYSLALPFLYKPAKLAQRVKTRLRKSTTGKYRSPCNSISNMHERGNCWKAERRVPKEFCSEVEKDLPIPPSHSDVLVAWITGLKAIHLASIIVVDTGSSKNARQQIRVVR